MRRSPAHRRALGWERCARAVAVVGALALLGLAAVRGLAPLAMAGEVASVVGLDALEAIGRALLRAATHRLDTLDTLDTAASVARGVVLGALAVVAGLETMGAVDAVARAAGCDVGGGLDAVLVVLGRRVARVFWARAGPARDRPGRRPRAGR